MGGSEDQKGEYSKISSPDDRSLENISKSGDSGRMLGRFERHQSLDQQELGIGRGRGRYDNWVSVVGSWADGRAIC